MVAIVVTKSAHKPSSCWGHYRKVAVVDVPYWKAWIPYWEPAMISEHSRDVYRVIRVWPMCSVGKTDRCAYRRAIKAAKALCVEYNSARDAATAEQIIGAGGSA